MQKYAVRAAFFGLACLFSGAANAVCLTLPNTLLNGVVADAALVMGNFNAIATCINTPGTLFGNQTANIVYAGPSSGAAASPAFRALVGADLPNPSSSSLGGVQSAAAQSNKWINSISTSGVPSLTQPATTNLSDVTTPTSWTPSDGSGAALTFTGVSANYQRVGGLVFAYAQLTYPATADGTSAVIAGFPVATPNQTYGKQCSVSYANAVSAVHMSMQQNTTSAVMSASDGTVAVNSNLSGKQLQFICIYPSS